MHKFASLCLLLLLGAFGWGLAALLEIRFGSGEVYPAGSSLRADREGTRVLHDSLARLLPVSRNFSALDGQDLRHMTLFLLQTNPAQIEDSGWQSLTKQGARVVIAFAPVMIQRTDRTLKALDLTLTYSAPTEEMQDVPAWQSGRETTLTFKAQSPAWIVLQRGTILERPFGAGSVVVLANAYLLSNQSLAQHPVPALLSRIVGPAERIVFEETHFGLRDKPGVMVLVRRYGLVGLLLALVTLAALFVWQASFPLVPLDAEGSQNLELRSDRTAESGLAQLLRRSIPESELMAACWREWERLAKPTRAQREAVRQATLPSNQPVAAFARATLALERKR